MRRGSRCLVTVELLTRDCLPSIPFRRETWHVEGAKVGALKERTYQFRDVAGDKNCNT